MSSVTWKKFHRSASRDCILCQDWECEDIVSFLRFFHLIQERQKWLETLPLFSCVIPKPGDYSCGGAPAMLSAEQMYGKKRDLPFGIYSINECNR